MLTQDRLPPWDTNIVSGTSRWAEKRIKSWMVGCDAMQVIIRKPCPFRQANELRAPTEYSYLPSGIIIMIPKTYYGARRQQRVKAMYEYTSFYGLLQLHTNTSSLILWAPNYPKNILLQCIEAAITMSATTITYNTFLPSVAISKHHQSIPGPSQVADQSTRYITSLLIVPGKF